MALGTVTSTYLDFGGDSTGYFDEPIYVGGSGISSLVPGIFDVSLAGHAYKIDTQYEAFRRESFRSQSIAPVADKMDITNIPGEASVNTESLWRREMQDWLGGAGQLFLDRRASQPNRFYQSKGVYVGLQNYASLLNDTVAVHSSGNELQVLVAGAYVYINDNGTVRYATGDLSSWSAVSGVTASTNNSALATDGNNVYIACGSNGIYIIKTLGGSAASWITTSSATITNVWYAGGQLLAAGTVSSAPTLFSIWLSTTASATAYTAAGPSSGTAVLFSPLNQKFTFTSCAAGNSWIYVGGYTSNSGSNNSVIYKIQMNTTATALTVPVAAATLPGGELVYGLFAYANFILVGTSLGARFCETLGLNDPGGNAGDLKMGPIVPDIVQPVTKPVWAFTGQFRWVWFGWSNYDAVSTGLGRMDLSTFIDQQAPAYTSDLMVTASGEIKSMDWYNGLNNIPGVNTGAPIFVVDGHGVYTAASTFVDEGIIDTGYITFGLPDNKVALQFDFNAKGTAGKVGALVTVDDDSVGAYQVSTQAVSNVLYKQALPSMSGELFDVQMQLSSGSSNTVSPILRRFQIKANPAVIAPTQHIYPLDCSFMVMGNGIDYPCNPYTEWQYLDSLRQSATPITVQEGNQLQVQVIITEIDWVRYALGPNSQGGFSSVLVVFTKSLEN